MTYLPVYHRHWFETGSVVSFGGHSSIIIIQQGRYEIIHHPPCTPDLTSIEFVFINIKNPLRVPRFSDNHGLIRELEMWFRAQTEEFYNHGIRRVGVKKKRWDVCNALRSEYTENY